MSKRNVAGIVLTMAFFMLAAFVIPANASAKEDTLHLDVGRVDHRLGGHESDWFSGYGIVAQRISLSADPDDILADGISTSTITAQLKDRRGNDVKVADVIIEFRTTRGTLSANSAITDLNGKATVTLTSSANEATAVIKATSDSVLNPDTTKVEFEKVGKDKKEHDENSGLSNNIRKMISRFNDVFVGYLF